MTRGYRRQVMFGDEADYRRFFEGLEQTVGRFGWELLGLLLIPNHLHLVLRTRIRCLARIALRSSLAKIKNQP